MGVSQTQKGLHWTFFIFLFLCLFSTAVFVAADETQTSDIYFDDIDQDGLTNDEEKIYGTDPNVADTDGDSYSDGVEIEGGYDPLKPAPGDRIVEDENASISQQTSDSSEIGTVPNMTAIASEQLAEIVSTKEEGEELTSEDLTGVLSSVMATSNEEIILPEVNTEDINVKELDEDLSDEERDEENREDVIEYLTLVSYILLSNAPVQIKDTDALQNFTMNTGKDVLVSLTTGNYDFLDGLEERSKKALDEINKVEVPESMLDTHVKAIKMLTFASNMKESIKATVSPEDPLGQMYMFARIQGFVLSMQNFMSETQGKLADFGINNIPLDI